MTKKEMIQEYEAGKYLRQFCYAVDYYNSVVILCADDEMVFGYTSYFSPMTEEEEKTFFKRKVYYDNEGIAFFKMDNRRYDLGDFMLLGAM